MTRIKPFRGVLYNKENITDLSKVMCPPYDVITKQEQENFYNSDPHNFIRIILGKEKVADNKKNNKYTRAKQYFNDWLDKNILDIDKAPCFYFYLQEYSYKGKKKKRLGFIALMKLERENSKVYPHENTRKRAKEDRLELIRELGANLSPIFAFFYDKERTINNVFQSYLVNQQPHISVTDKDNVTHKMWHLSDTALINKIKDYMQDEHIFIADGHHRYEVALNFYNEMKMHGNDSVVKKGYNYVMTYFTNLNSDDLLILPIHRIIKNMPKDIRSLEDDFYIEKVKNKNDLFSTLEKNICYKGTFGFYRNKEFILLRLKNQDRPKELIAHGSEKYKDLDVSILEFMVFQKLGITSDDLAYRKDENEAIKAVDNNVAEAVFFLNPIKVQQLRDIALGGEKMPPKSTYFYPKLLSGLTVNKFGI